MDINDIARLAGVSPSTVSKVINHKDESISQQTRERVQKIVREFHYVPHAKSRASRNWLLGVCFRSPISLDSTLDGILRVAQSRGYSTLVYNSYSSLEQERKNLMALRNSGAVGILWEPVSADSLDALPDLTSADTHVITIGPNGGDRSLLLPYEAASYAITSKLLSAGHTRVACLAMEGRRTPGFISGFKRCLFEHGAAFDEGSLFHGPSDALLDKIGRGEVTGVVCSHYYIAQALHARLERIHYHSPEDYSLVSLRNDVGSSWVDESDGSISTCTLHNFEFGQLICETLLQRVEGVDEPPRFDNDFRLDNVNSLGRPPQSKAKRVVVVGSVNMDTRLSVDALPSWGSTITAERSYTYLGGKGANQAIGIAKFGHKVSLIGCVGSDASSDTAYRLLEDWGVDTSGVYRQHGAETGRAYIFGNPEGESIVSVLSGANACLHAEGISSREALFDGACCCIAQSEVPLDAIEAAFGIAKSHDALTIFRPTVCESIPSGILSNVDLLVLSERELAVIASPGEDMEKSCKAFMDRGAGAVIVTQGEQGCTLFNEEGTEHFDAVPNTAVDTTGAGDAFISALAACLLDGNELHVAIRKANYAASCSITRFGVAKAMIDRHALECARIA
ncbi:MAG: PfkB family carbohydrate kinase [Collinsella sp.]|nr:PfkB family carbohydrate kinase [Collinsella sp.]